MVGRPTKKKRNQIIIKRNKKKEIVIEWADVDRWQGAFGEGRSTVGSWRHERTSGPSRKEIIDAICCCCRECERERESSRKCKTWMVQIVWETHPLSFVSSSFRLLECGRRKNNTSAKCNLSLSQKISFLCCYVIGIETCKRSNCFDQVIFLRETKWFREFQFRIEDTAIEIIVQTWSGTHVRDNPELDRCRQMPDPVRLVRFGR
jgi:hypothetical protein